VSLQQPDVALQLLNKVTEADPRDYDALVRQAEIYMVRRGAFLAADTAYRAWP
jgi:Tfp pilus assembly protein PilF